MLDSIKQRHAEYHSFMGDGSPDWLKGNEDKLSDASWLALVAVPWLLKQIDDKNRGANQYTLGLGALWWDELQGKKHD